jgi:hypothetical protein
VCVELVGESPDVGCLDALDKWERLQMWDVRMGGACEGVSRCGTCGWLGHVKVSQDEGCMDGSVVSPYVRSVDG